MVSDTPGCQTPLRRLVPRAHTWHAGRTAGPADRQPAREPRLEASDHVAGALEAELDERCCGEARRVAVVADQDQLPFEIVELRVSPRAVGIGAPLEHCPRNVQR